MLRNLNISKNVIMMSLISLFVDKSTLILTNDANEDDLDYVINGFGNYFHDEISYSDGSVVSRIVGIFNLRDKANAGFIESSRVFILIKNIQDSISDIKTQNALIVMIEKAGMPPGPR